MKAAGGIIDMGDPQPLPATVLGVEAGSKKAARSLMTIEERRRFGTLKPHVGKLWDGPASA